MGWIVTILVGALIGWIASLIMRTDAEQGALANILIGVFGSLLGSWLFGNVLGFGGATTAGDLSLTGVLWGVLGAVILIAILKFFQVMGTSR
jgi:uncharacterized membrane protein YeaQ/YmgE (transglycosylase-associated protein family)